MRAAVCFLLGMLAATAGIANAQTGQDRPAFRIGVLGPAATVCATETGIAGADALAIHLSARLQRKVEICTFSNTTEAGQALAEGRADFAMLDAAGAAIAGPGVRSLMTRREPGSIGRILSVAVVRADSPAQSLADLQPGRFVFGGTGPAQHDGPKAAILGNGALASAINTELFAASPAEAFSKLQSGEADVLVLHASAWQRTCRGEKASDRPCAGMREIFRGRQPAETAFGVRTDLDAETRLRLVGILMAMHLENRAAFDWLAPGATELTPTEATALARAPR
jgi:ABC-type phosphate/phosphonate transport system substrate-binding protein